MISVRHAAVATCALFMACGGTDAPPELDGSWYGNPILKPPLATPEMWFHLTQSGADVTGQGGYCYFCDGFGKVIGHFDVVGSNNGGNVALSLSGTPGTNFNTNYTQYSKVPAHFAGFSRAPTSRTTR